MSMILQGSWHGEGLFMGMHWAWWIFWIAAAAVIVWALWRLRADRVDARRAAARSLAAEEALRERFARGEIDEDELAARMAALRASPEG
jgi:putative membrane protein